MTTKQFLLVLGFAVLSTASCNKQDEQAHTGPAVSTLEYKTPTQEVMERSDALQATRAASRGGRHGATSEQIAQAREVLLEATEGTRFILDDTGEKLSHIGEPPNEIPLEQASLAVADKAVADGVSFERDSLKQLAHEYLIGLQDGLAAQYLEQSQAEQIATTGRIVESAAGDDLPKLDPAPQVVGRWQSLREVSFSSATRVNHTANYHQLLDIKNDKTVQWTYFRNGMEFSNEKFTWTFDKSTGELALSHPGGQLYQTLKVYTTQFEPGVIYIETPGMEMLKVFGPAQEQGR